MVAGGHRGLAGGGRRAIAPHGLAARVTGDVESGEQERAATASGAAPVHGLTYNRLKRASFTHSTIYAILLAVWIIPGLHQWEFVFGLAHGLGWIAMSIACIYAAR